MDALWRMCEEGCGTGLDRPVRLQSHVSGRGGCVVVKVFLGEVARARDAHARPPSAAAPALSSSASAAARITPAVNYARSLDGAAPEPTREEYPGVDAVYRAAAPLPGHERLTDEERDRRREWFIFDEALCLPEYFVEFEPMAARGSRVGVPESVRAAVAGPAAHAMSEADTAELDVLITPLAALAASVQAEVRRYETAVRELPQGGRGSLADNDGDDGDDTLRSSATPLTPLMLQARCLDPSTVVVLNLTGMGLDSVDGLAPCVVSAWCFFGVLFIFSVMVFIDQHNTMFPLL
jgi:hypothetical protein